MIARMETIKATELKNRLGAALERAALAPIAIERHGRVVAYLVPAEPAKARPASGRRHEPGWDRRTEERAVELASSGDFRPSRWLRAGDPGLLAGICMILASHRRFDRTRMLALAERLRTGMSSPAMFGRWLKGTPLHAERFVALLEARLHERALAA
jgi:antitoxin (DNA-binding transcriptional repressor) of toxin-antitoxin stability system